MRELFKVGEKIRLLHAKGEGIVQRIISPSRVEVLIDDFYEMELGVDEVVKVNVAEAILKREEEEEDAPKKKAKQAGTGPIRQLPNLPPSFVLFKNGDLDYEFWILNQGRNELLFGMYLRVGNKFISYNSGIVPPGENYFLGRQSPQEFHMARSIYLQCLQFPRIEHPKPIPSFALEINCKTDIFVKAAKNVPELNVEGWEFLLVDKLEAGLFDDADSELRVQANKVPKPPKVVDLHLEKLVDNMMGIDSATMLRLQIEAFEKAITDAQAHPVESMVFIHGIGTGKLKKEIHSRLMEYAFVSNFELADPILYGNGATIVYF